MIEHVICEDTWADTFEYRHGRWFKERVGSGCATQLLCLCPNCSFFVHAQGLPPTYNAAVHASAMRRAAHVLSSLAHGPARHEAAQKLCSECEALWADGRQQCRQVSVTGRLCGLPLGHAGPHTSRCMWTRATASGQDLVQISDPFDLAAANGGLVAGAAAPRRVMQPQGQAQAQGQQQDVVAGQRSSGGRPKGSATAGGTATATAVGADEDSAVASGAPGGGGGGVCVGGSREGGSSGSSSLDVMLVAITEPGGWQKKTTSEKKKTFLVIC